MNISHYGRSSAIFQSIKTVFPLPDNTSFVLASAVCQYIANTNAVDCAWEQLEKKGKRTAYIYIRPLERESMMISAHTGADNFDPNSANNLAEKSFRVR